MKPETIHAATCAPVRSGDHPSGDLGRVSQARSADLIRNPVMFVVEIVAR